MLQSVGGFAESVYLCSVFGTETGTNKQNNEVNAEYILVVA
jgi:hypothetical protein